MTHLELLLSLIVSVIGKQASHLYPKVGAEKFADHVQQQVRVRDILGGKSPQVLVWYKA